MRERHGPRWCRVALPGVCALLLFCGISAADAPRDYSYLFLQGKISDFVESRTVSGLTVRLVGDSRVFETVTDQRGVFVFEKLPVTTYELEIRAPDGRVLCDTREARAADPSRSRVHITLGNAAPRVIRIVPDQEGIALDVPRPRTRWRKLWMEAGILTGLLGLLAL